LAQGLRWKAYDMLKVKNLSMGYNGMPVLWDVNFEVDDGELTVLVGANGVGKSSILKTISGLQVPMKGSVEFNGKMLSDISPEEIIKEGVIHVPEGRKLFSEMTVEENLIMGALHGIAKERRKITIEKCYSLFPHLKVRRKQIARNLSGGEQQMVAIARGLMSLPKLLMLDEPSLGLSPVLVQDIFEIIMKINKEGITILLVEQNVKMTLSFCSKAYLVENGRLMFSGTGDELLNNEHVKSAYLGVS
jgi:branched-chain amino acid transport system ATP-binding protein